MSLEQALAEHGALLKANTEALLASNAGRSEALAAAKAVTDKVAAPKAAKVAAAAPAEPAAETPVAVAEPVAETPVAVAEPVAETAKPVVDISADPVAKSISDYISLTSDTDSTATGKEERAARVAEVSRIMGTVGATKHTEIPADKRDIFIKTMVAKLAKGNLVVVEAEEPAAVEAEEPAAEDALLG